MEHSNLGTGDIPIKGQSFPPEERPIPDPQNPLKRQRSNGSKGSQGSQDTGEKRQRISPQPETSAEIDFEALLAQAAAAASKEVENYQEAPTQPVATADAVPKDGALADAQDTTIPTFDPYLHMRILSLPILESLSVQILATLASGNYNQAIETVTSPDSDSGQAYATLKSLFDQTKKIYSNDSLFFNPDDLGMKDKKQREIIQRTNLATFLTSVFSGTGVGFYDLHDNFLEVFAPDGQFVQKDHGELFINLKTQVFVAAVSSNDPNVPPGDTIEALFPQTVGADLVERHPGLLLSQDEFVIVQNIIDRREYLSSMCKDMASIELLSEEFTWEQFLRGISEYLNKVYEPICAPYLRKHSIPTTRARPKPRPSQNHAVRQNDLPMKSIEEEANAAAQRVLESMGLGLTQNGNSEPQQPEYIRQVNLKPQQDVRSVAGRHLPGAQSEPTAILYERARMAADHKTTWNSRKSGAPSQRRPWSTEEETTLMHGLDQVKGPHWSKILNLYGPNGSVNAVLKDRNQVQLKDKARNLKLFFLKGGIEVPHYLSQVTGELKTRAPSQAARLEMQERELLTENHGSADVDAIMALGQGRRGCDSGLGSLSDSPTLSSASMGDEVQEESLEPVEPAEQQSYFQRTQSEQQREDQRFSDDIVQRLMAGMASEPAHYGGDFGAFVM